MRLNLPLGRVQPRAYLPYWGDEVALHRGETLRYRSTGYGRTRQRDFPGEGTQKGVAVPCEYDASFNFDTFVQKRFDYEWYSMAWAFCLDSLTPEPTSEELAPILRNETQNFQ